VKILIIAIPSEYFPVGIAYISASLKAARHDVDCYTSTIPDDLRWRLEAGDYILATGGLSSQ
jgi:hypothetical protein